MNNFEVKNGYLFGTAVLKTNSIEYYNIQYEINPIEEFAYQELSYNFDIDEASEMYLVHSDGSMKVDDILNTFDSSGGYVRIETYNGGMTFRGSTVEFLEVIGMKEEVEEKA